MNRRMQYWTAARIRRMPQPGARAQFNRGRSQPVQRKGQIENPVHVSNKKCDDMSHDPALSVRVLGTRPSSGSLNGILHRRAGLSWAAFKRK
jgi:hypothetical protein